MSALEIILWLASIAALSTYLYLKHRQRMRSQRYEPAAWTGKGIDVTKLRPTVEDVRRAQLAARRSARGMLVHRSLLGLARQTVAHLAYFRDRQSEEHASAHAR